MNNTARPRGATRVATCAWLAASALASCGAPTNRVERDGGAEDVVAVTPPDAGPINDVRDVSLADAHDAVTEPAADATDVPAPSSDSGAQVVDVPARDAASDAHSVTVDVAPGIDVVRDATIDVARDVAVDAARDATIDAGVDVPPDRPPSADGGCAPPPSRPRQDPCPGVASCGFATRGRVRFTGARAALREFQVRVVLPASVRGAAGASCDRLVFRAASGAWAPHWVQDCAAGAVWVRVPTIDPGGTELAMHYGGGAAVPSANSYDDVFDRVPLGAPGLLGAWTFDEGSGTRTCPAAGSVHFDAFLGATPYDGPHPEVAARPPLWTADVPPSPLGRARFTRDNRALDFPRSQVIDDPARPAVTRPWRLVNWRTPDSTPLRSTVALTVGVWVYVETPADEFNDNWQTVVSYGMPADPRPPFPGANVSMLGTFNPWAIFFQGVNLNETVLMANTCTYPCLADDDYAHIATRDPLPRDALLRAWHFVAMTVDTSTAPHATRRAFYDGRVFDHPRDMVTWPPEMYCPGGTCRYPPEGRIQYYNAPVILGGDMNSGEVALGLEGRLDDLFILSRAAAPDELVAWRERRQYSPDPIAATVTP